MVGWAMAEGMVQLMTKAVQIAGGKTPTRAQVVQAASDVSFSSPFAAGVTWTATDHYGTTMAHIMGLQDGKYTTLTAVSTLPAAQ